MYVYNVYGHLWHCVIQCYSSCWFSPLSSLLLLFCLELRPTWAMAGVLSSRTVSRADFLSGPLCFPRLGITSGDWESMGAVTIENHSCNIKLEPTFVMFSFSITTKPCRKSQCLQPLLYSNVKYNTVKPLITDHPRYGQPLYNRRTTCPQLTSP